MSIKFLLLLLWSPFTTAVDYAATCHETCAQCNDCKSEFNFISYTSQQGKQPTDPLYTCIPCLGIESETDCESCGKCKSCVGCMACVRDACNSHFHLELGEKSCEFCADYMVCIHNPKLKICEESKQCQHCTIAVGCNAELFAIATDRTYANAYYQSKLFCCT